jgi:hypothetical protein
VARTFRLWEKKRGDRRTGSPLVGGLGEALFFGVLFLLGSVSSAYLIAAHGLGAAPPLRQPGFGFWLMVLVVVSFMLIGGSGVVYTVLQVGTSAERRSALARRAAQFDLLSDALLVRRAYPTIPPDANLTNSPGVRLAYRLPVTHAGPWVLFVSTAFVLVWNSIAVVLGMVALRGHLAARPDWYLSVFVLALAAIGVWATYFFVHQVLRHTGIGPTTVEISDHPLWPGRTYDLYVSQTGRFHIRSFEVLLVCEEEATYRQGTDLRTERCRVHAQELYRREEFRIEPGDAFEVECRLPVPALAMHSLQTHHNAVHWMVLVRNDAASWPLIERSFPVVVLPGEVAEVRP